MTRSQTATAVHCMVVLLAAACSGSAAHTGAGQDGGAGSFVEDGGGLLGGNAQAGDLVFQPASATVVVTGAGPQHASFTLEARNPDGTFTSVVPDAVEFDRPDLAAVTDGSPVVATAPATQALYGGMGTIHAVYRGASATATLTVNVELAVYGPGLGPTSPGVSALNGSGLPNDPAPDIDPLLYPYDRTVWPLGLTSPLVMWNAPQANDVYRLHYAEKNYVLDAYYTLASLPGQLRLDQGDWPHRTMQRAPRTRSRSRCPAGTTWRTRPT